MEIKIDEELLTLLGANYGFDIYTNYNVSDYRAGQKIPNSNQVYETITPVLPHAEAFAKALLNVIATKVRLEAYSSSSVHHRDRGPYVDANNRAMNYLYSLMKGV